MRTPEDFGLSSDDVRKAMDMFTKLGVNKMANLARAFAITLFMENGPDEVFKTQGFIFVVMMKLAKGLLPYAEGMNDGGESARNALKDGPFEFLINRLDESSG